MPPELLSTGAEAGVLLVSFVVPVALLLLAFPSYLRYLTRIGRISNDAHKSPPLKVPEPAGPLLFVGVLAGELVAAAALHSLIPLAILFGAAVAFVIGLVDDLYVLGGKTKPLLLLLAGFAFVSVSLLKPGLYQPVLTFPILGDTSPHFIIYTALAVVAFPVVTNAFNMMDAFNGEISWFTLLTSLALLAGVVLHDLYTAGFSPARVAAVLPLVGVAGVFLLYNRYPARAFDGDSGSLMFGATFAGLAITGGVEVAAMIAIVPAILNSFYTLSSVRGFVERRKMASRPTYMGSDGLLHASTEKGAPNTLVRLVLLASAMSEKELVLSIVSLTGVACVFSVAISILTWVHL
jgi:UDP-GlcNAc:undecaprenyl-phosphate/decaprenyl-phosphate GlcNAc-1-phosphate transferase